MWCGGGGAGPKPAAPLHRDMKENKVSSRLSLELLSTLNINLARLSVLLYSSARSSRGFTIKSKVIVTCESMCTALSNAVTGHQEPEDW